MTDADIQQYVGFLFLAYATGWGSGYVIYVFRRATDFL